MNTTRFVYLQALRKIDRYEYPKDEIQALQQDALSHHSNKVSIELLNEVMEHWDATIHTFGYQRWKLKQEMKNLIRGIGRAICGK